MSKEINPKIYETKDYGKFKVLEGNRDLTDDRVKKIIKSIEEVGYILSPILINEKKEVIDGQGRLEALKRLGLPVHYIVQEGIGIDECTHMNIHQSNWTEYDYVQSYAKRGLKDYQRLQSLLDNISLPNEVIFAAIADPIDEKRDRELSAKIKKGKIKLSEETASSCKWELEYAENLKAVAQIIGGRSKPFYVAVIYSYRNLDSEKRNRLADIIQKNKYEFESYSNVVSYLRMFDGEYNKKYKPKKGNKLCLALSWQTDHNM